MRPADDHHASAAAGTVGKVQGAMELLALHSHQRQQCATALGPIEQEHLPHVCMDVTCRPLRIHQPAACRA
ncbi:MAG: hypothetical protein HQ518_03925 [Rhodopirellula sp.]|nr:hypothetical protein [Rhodopirellula sp.]